MRLNLLAGVESLDSRLRGNDDCTHECHSIHRRPRAGGGPATFADPMTNIAA
jgi:hypothetical protein